MGEAPPASGRFFYAEDSGLYRAFRDAWLAAHPDGESLGFLPSFRARGWFLTDLCPDPVDRLAPALRRAAREAAEPRLARTLRRLDPERVLVVVRAVLPNARRAAAAAGWAGPLDVLSYPGRWTAHRRAFARGLARILAADG